MTGGKNKSFPGMDTGGRGVGTRKGMRMYTWWMYFVSIYENGRMKHVEIVLRRQKGEKGE
jgi:hypothetical protein